jgi:hypothetical protein
LLINLYRYEFYSKSKSFDCLPYIFQRRDKDLYIFKLSKILDDTDLDDLKEFNRDLYDKVKKQIEVNKEEFEKLKEQYVDQIGKIGFNMQL